MGRHRNRRPRASRPLFFVPSGIAFDLKALFASASTVAVIPLFVLALLVVRGVPAIAYRGVVGTRRTVAAALLLATSLPFIVTASTIGVSLGVLTAATGAALVAAGLLSVLAFPLAALTLLRSADGAEVSRGVGGAEAAGMERM
jgi:Kef-type K+ transport system membrane component KefB